MKPGRKPAMNMVVTETPIVTPDVIIGMEGGRIAAIGTHEELMQTSEEYRSVYESQTRHSDNEEGGDAQ